MDQVAELFEEVVGAFRVRLTVALGEMREARSPRAFCDAERVLQNLAHELAAKMTQRVLQGASDDEERVREAQARIRERAAARGITVRNAGRRRTPIRTIGGQIVEVSTPYVVGSPRGGGTNTRRGAQGTGVYPILDELGISGRSTPGLRLLVSRAVCEANSVSSARDLLAAGGVAIDHKAALRLTYLVTDDALRAREEAVTSTTEGNDLVPFAGRRVVAAIDGGRLQVRRRVAGRPKKGGRKRFITEWREPKILTIYVLNEAGRRERSIPSVIDGTLGNADAAFKLLSYHLRRLGVHKAAELTLIGDAAEWIWNRASSLRESLGLAPERFHEIVDYFHVVERLGEMSKTQLKWGEQERLAWLHTQKKRLKEGRIEEIEAVVRTISKRDAESMKAEHAYWSRNRERLRYAVFRGAGLPIGSGAVESAVRRVINLRLMGASVCWTEQHAEGVLHLRAHAKSGRWKELEDTVLSSTGWRPTARLRRRTGAA
jgi:hypothetical protein